MPPPSTPVAVYARFSTDEQDPRSIEDQTRRCTEHAQLNSMEVVAEFADAAISGSHMDRAQLRRMLDVATATLRAPFKAVLVDDLSRLSRNMGDFWRVVDDLGAAGVTVIDVQTGMSSDDPNARSMFGMKSVFNDHFLQQVRYHTHRGLKGRALAGFWTGGRVYGYTTIEEESPANPDRPRHVPVIDDDEAAVVRRIFEMFIEGRGLKSIADLLNREGIRAPHDGNKGHKGHRGWVHGTIRNVLRNERYIGRWTWNTTKWAPPRPGKKSRRRVARPQSEWVVRELPELSIVDAATWEKARLRLRRQTAGGGRPAGVGKSQYLTSGLLRCGTCGGPISVVGQKKKNGIRYATMGCSTHYSRGGAICVNNQTIAEKRITGALVEALRELFTDDRVVHRVTASVAAHVQKLAKPTKSNATAAAIAEVEGRIRNLTDALAKMPASTALLDRLGDEERRLAELKAAKRTGSAKSLRAPTEAQVRGFLSNLMGTLEADPVAGRRVLHEMMSPLTLTPKTAPRGYECRAELRLPDGLGVGSDAEVIRKCGSGGRI